jgi:hypothetical protein
MASFRIWQFSAAPAALSFLALAAMPLGACGSSGAKSGGSDSGSGDDVATGGDDGGQEDAMYPAFPVDYPLVQKNQGAVLASPVLVTVSWPGDDTNASTWEAFDDALGASSYWTATTSQYGVGAAVSGPSNHVRMTQPLPSSLSYTDLQNFVIATLSGTTSGDGGAPGGDAGPPNPAWPAPAKDASGNVETIYSLFIPQAVNVTDPGSGMSFCSEGGFSYHDSVSVGGSQVPYSVTLQCAGFPIAETEESAAHELIEAATDPYSESTTLGYVGFDADHIAWPFYDGSIDEVADACQNWEDSYFQDTGDFPYWVQRSWSNQAAPQGHDPCVPAATGAYQGMTLLSTGPSTESAVTINLTTLGGSSSQKTKGFKVTKGQPLTFQVGFFSDAPTAPWPISHDFPATLPLFDTTGNQLGNGAATVTLDTTSGQNGDKVNVTVTVTKAGAAGFHVMAITWDPPTQSAYLPHYLPVLLVDQ